MAGRTRFMPYVYLTIIVSTITYPLCAHWVWSPQGWLYSLGQYGSLDFSGGGPVHLLGGTLGLLGAIVVGPRIEFSAANQQQRWRRGHNKLMAASGAVLLWTGWLAFTTASGATVEPSEQASVSGRVVSVTLLSGASAAVTSFVWRRMFSKEYDLIWLANSLMAGSASITAPCAVIQPWGAIVIGACAALLLQVVSSAVLRLGIDDPTDMACVHIVGGVWGLIAAAFFADPVLISQVQDIPAAALQSYGLLYGGGAGGYLLAYQLAEIFAIVGWTVVTCLPALLLLQHYGRLRVSKEAELGGLDLFKHDVAWSSSGGDSSGGGDDAGSGGTGTSTSGGVVGFSGGGEDGGRDDEEAANDDPSPSVNGGSGAGPYAYHTSVKGTWAGEHERAGGQQQQQQHSTSSECIDASGVRRHGILVTSSGHHLHAHAAARTVRHEKGADVAAADGEPVRTTGSSLQPQQQLQLQQQSYDYGPGRIPLLDRTNPLANLNWEDEGARGNDNTAAAAAASANMRYPNGPSATAAWGSGGGRRAGGRASSLFNSRGGQSRSSQQQRHSGGGLRTPTSFQPLPSSSQQQQQLQQYHAHLRRSRPGTSVGSSSRKTVTFGPPEYAALSPHSPAPSRYERTGASAELARGGGGSGGGGDMTAEDSAGFLFSTTPTAPNAHVRACEASATGRARAVGDDRRMGGGLLPTASPTSQSPGVASAAAGAPALRDKDVPTSLRVSGEDEASSSTLSNASPAAAMLQEPHAKAPKHGWLDSVVGSLGALMARNGAARTTGAVELPSSPSSAPPAPSNLDNARPVESTISITRGGGDAPLRNESPAADSTGGSGGGGGGGGACRGVGREPLLHHPGASSPSTANSPPAGATLKSLTEAATTEPATLATHVSMTAPRELTDVEAYAERRRVASSVEAGAGDSSSSELAFEHSLGVGGATWTIHGENGGSFGEEDHANFNSSASAEALLHPSAAEVEVSQPATGAITSPPAATPSFLSVSHSNSVDDVSANGDVGSTSSTRGSSAGTTELAMSSPSPAPSVDEKYRDGTAGAAPVGRGDHQMLFSHLHPAPYEQQQQRTFSPQIRAPGVFYSETPYGQQQQQQQLSPHPHYYNYSNNSSAGRYPLAAAAAAPPSMPAGPLTNQQLVFASQQQQQQQQQHQLQYEMMMQQQQQHRQQHEHQGYGSNAAGHPSVFPDHPPSSSYLALQYQLRHIELQQQQQQREYDLTIQQLQLQQQQHQQAQGAHSMLPWPPSSTPFTHGLQMQPSVSSEIQHSRHQQYLQQQLQQQQYEDFLRQQGSPPPHQPLQTQQQQQQQQQQRQRVRSHHHHQRRAARPRRSSSTRLHKGDVDPEAAWNTTLNTQITLSGVTTAHGDVGGPVLSEPHDDEFIHHGVRSSRGDNVSTSGGGGAATPDGAARGVRSADSPAQRVPIPVTSIPAAAAAVRAVEGTLWAPFDSSSTGGDGSTATSTPDCSSSEGDECDGGTYDDDADDDDGDASFLRDHGGRGAARYFGGGRRNNGGGEEEEGFDFERGEAEAGVETPTDDDDRGMDDLALDGASYEPPRSITSHSGHSANATLYDSAAVYAQFSRSRGPQQGQSQQQQQRQQPLLAMGHEDSRGAGLMYPPPPPNAYGGAAALSGGFLHPRAYAPVPGNRASPPYALYPPPHLAHHMMYHHAAAVPFPGTFQAPALLNQPSAAAAAAAAAVPFPGVHPSLQVPSSMQGVGAASLWQRTLPHAGPAPAGAQSQQQQTPQKQQQIPQQQQLQQQQQATRQQATRQQTQPQSSTRVSDTLFSSEPTQAEPKQAENLADVSLSYHSTTLAPTASSDVGPEPTVQSQSEADVRTDVLLPTVAPAATASE